LRLSVESSTDVVATDWDAITLAGAFVIGLTLGIFSAIRVMRAVFGYTRSFHMFRGAQKPPPPGGDEGS
jgi:hypothetical protein